MMSRTPPEFAPFFEHARQGELRFPNCDACGRFHWYPMPRCPHCYQPGWRWQRVSGMGEVHSYTVVRHAFDASRRDALPYVVALVTFPDAPGVRFITNIEGDMSAVRIGARVEPVFPRGEDMRVTFRLVPEYRSQS